MLNNRKLFPLGKAYGAAFCNREQETARLLGNIQAAKHTLIIAPRRYGKSSLAERAIEQSGLATIKINFHLCTSEAEIAQLVIDSVTKLIGNTIGHLEKTISSIKRYLANLEPFIAFGGEKISLKLVSKAQANHAIVITEALLLLEKLLAEKNKKAIIFLDEFQEIGRISKEKGIEGAFRTAAQEMQQISLIFSGSVRSLLLSMFENENRPLYKLCRKIKLERIAAHDYEKHIQKIAKKTWGKQLSAETMQRIIHISNRHPYYVNYLCDTLWEMCGTIPTIADVEKAWTTVVMEEWSDALRELAELPMGQRRLLRFIANHHEKNLQSQECALTLSMPPSSIATALHALTEKDFIELQQNHYYGVINPLLSAVLSGVEDE